MQDELLGISGKEGTNSAAAQIDPDVLYAVGEDERVRTPDVRAVEVG